MSDSTKSKSRATTIGQESLQLSAFTRCIAFFKCGKTEERSIMVRHSIIVVHFDLCKGVHESCAN